MPSIDRFVHTYGQCTENIEHNHNRSPLLAFEPRIQFSRSNNVSWYVKGVWFHRVYNIDFTHLTAPLPNIRIHDQVTENNFGFGPGIRLKRNRFFVDFSVLLTSTRVTHMNNFTDRQELRGIFSSEDRFRDEWNFSAKLLDENLGRLYFEWEFGILAAQQRLSIGVKYILQHKTNAVEQVFSYAYASELNDNTTSILGVKMNRGMQFIGLSMGYDLVKFTRD